MQREYAVSHCYCGEKKQILLAVLQVRSTMTSILPYAKHSPNLFRKITPTTDPRLKVIDSEGWGIIAVSHLLAHTDPMGISLGITTQQYDLISNRDMFRENCQSNLQKRCENKEIN